MTRKLRRSLLAALSLVVLLCAMGVCASAETYTVGSEFESESKDAQLPELTNPAFVWEGPETLYEINACGKTEHTHDMASCSYRKAQDDETPDFGMNLYYIPVYDNPEDPDEWRWAECTKEEYDKARHSKMVYTYFVWTCSSEAHKHTDECNKITGYRWKVTAANRSEHTIYKHIKIYLKNAPEGIKPSDVTVTVSYADGSKVVVPYETYEDDGGWLYTNIHNSNVKEAFISNDTDDKSCNHIVGVKIEYSCNDVSGSYSVDTFAGLEAARLACPNNQWARSSGLDITVQVAADAKYYYKIVKNYLLDDTVVYSQTVGDEAVETGAASVTVTPEPETTYNGQTYKFDGTAESFKNIDISASANDASKAVAVNINYKRYSVSHEFASATAGKELPESVKTRLPESTSVAKGGAAYPETDEFDKVYVYVNGTTVGTWTFDGWDKESVENVGAPVKFVGSWSYTESDKTEGVYSVSCKFVSGTEGKELPEGVMSQLPEGIVLDKGTAVPDDYAFEPFTEKDASGNLKGTWNLDSWVKQADDNGNVIYTGTWVFTVIDTYSVTYKWAEGGDVPADAVLPTDSKTYRVGEAVTVAASPTTASNQNGEKQGKWQFLGWNTSALPDGKMAAPADGSKSVTVTGEWKFTEDVKHSYTLTYVGNGGTTADGKTSLTDSESRSDIYDTSLVMKADANPFTYEGYEFKGWAESLEAAAAGSATIQPDDDISFTTEMSGKTLYAVWKRVEFSAAVSCNSTGYTFNDGDTVSFEVAINGVAEGKHTISYTAASGWDGFEINKLKKGDVITVTELAPAKDGYDLVVTTADGTEISATGGSYTQTLTMTDADNHLGFANNYTVCADEDEPDEDETDKTTPATHTDAPFTDDGQTPLALSTALMLASAAALLGISKKRKTK